MHATACRFPIIRSWINFFFINVQQAKHTVDVNYVSLHTRADDVERMPGPNGEQVIQIDVGTDFCITREDNLVITLVCNLEGGPDGPQPIPLPSRAWSKDGDEIYSLLTNVQPVINDSFFTVEGNQILGPLEINPRVFTVTPDGFIQLVTLAFNVSDTATATIDMTVPLRGLVVDAVIGDYECDAFNVYGSDVAVTSIRLCGELFFVVYMLLF